VTQLSIFLQKFDSFIITQICDITSSVRKRSSSYYWLV